MSEADLTAAILREFGTRPDMRLFRSNTGAARTRTGRLVRFGVPGQSDITGLRLPHGQFIAIEVKAPRGKQSEAQKRWQAMIEKYGGVYVLARSVEDVREVLG